MLDVLADDVEVERRPHDDGAIAAQHGDDVVGVEMETTEQFVEIAEADRARDHAKEAAVPSRDAPAQHDDIGATMQHRPADEQAGIGLIAVHLEVLLVGAVFGHRIQRGGVDGQSPFGIEHLDRPEMLGVRGLVEQDQIPQRFAEFCDLRNHHVAGDRAQRQVVELDVAADVGVDAGGEILQGLAGQLLLATAHVEHDAGADRGEAEHRDDRRDDQQLGG